MNNRRVIITKQFKQLPGEYAGFMRINNNKLHIFKMDNGDVIKRFSFLNVEFLDGKPVKQFPIQENVES